MSSTAKILVITLIGAMIFGLWPWSAPVARAQEEFCKDKNDYQGDKLLLDNNKIVHNFICRSDNQVGPITFAIKEPKPISGENMFVVRSAPPVSEYDNPPLVEKSAIEARLVAIGQQFEMYGLQIGSKNFYIAVNINLSPPQAVAGVWTKSKFGDIYLSHDSAFYQYYSSKDLGISNKLAEEYLNHLSEYIRDSGVEVSRGEKVDAECEVLHYQALPEKEKNTNLGHKEYFAAKYDSLSRRIIFPAIHWGDKIGNNASAPGSDFWGPLLGYAVSGIDTWQFPPQPYATMDITEPTGSEKENKSGSAWVNIGPDYGQLKITIPFRGGFTFKIDRLPLKFKYSYYTQENSSTYFYFVGEGANTGSTCKLMLRVADRVRSQKEGEGAIIVGEVTKLQAGNLGLNDPNTWLAAFKINAKDWQAFIDQLCTRYDSGGCIKKTNSTTKVDELGGKRGFNALNPEASGFGQVGQDKCEKFGQIDLIIAKLPTLGKALCEAGFAFAGIAAVIAGWTFNLLLSAAQLQ